MITRDFKKTIVVSAFTIFLSVTFLLPVYANFLPFLSKKTILPNEYSKLEETIEIYNKQAIELFEEGHFKEAQELWEKAVAIMENSRGYAPEFTGSQEGYTYDEEVPADFSTEDISETSEIEDLYKTAVSAFKNQKYVAAKKMFDRVEAQTPDYKATRNYLTILKHKIRQAEQSLSGDKFKENALSREAERGEWKKILAESEKELEQRLIEQVTPLYNEALQHYKSRNFKLAKDYFEEIDSILPKYKDTSKYLSRIDIDIKGEEQLRLKEKYKMQTLARKKEQDEWHQIIEESEKKLEEKMKQQAEPVYQEALYYYKEREFELAKNRLQEVERIFPDYKSTTKYLSRIDQDVKDEIERREQQRLREYEQQIREKELAQKREEERLARLRELEEKNKLQQFQREVATRRKEREEWLMVLKESEMERQRKLTDQADFVYQEAVQYYKRREFEGAREGFQEVDGILPGYKSTSDYLAKIEHDLAQEEQQRLVQQERMIQKKIKEDQFAERQKDEEERQFRVIEGEKRMREFKERASARRKQRDEWDRVLRKNEQERQKRLKKEADFIYQDALRSYKKQQWEAARSGFLEAQEVLPGHKKSEKYLARIDDDIQAAEMRSKAKVEKEIERQKQKDALARKAEEERQMKLLENDRRKQLAKQEDQAEAVYKYALSLYQKGDYALAKAKFREVEEISTGYKSTQKYLGRINEDITNVQGFSRQEEEFATRQYIRGQQIAQLRDEEKLKQLLENEEKERLKALKEESLARQRDRKEWERTIAQIEAENQKRLQRQADSTYQEALRYYKAGWYEQAKEAFGEVEQTVPGYKSTSKYIALADQNIQSEGKFRKDSELKIQEYMDREEALYKSKQQRQALSMPVPEKNGSLVIKKAVEERRREIVQQAEVKYREALDLFKTNNFIEAKLKFIEVESFSPGYKATLDYLARIDQEISGQEMINSRDRLIEQALLQVKGDSAAQEPKKASIKLKKENPPADVRRSELKAQRRLIQKKYNDQFNRLYVKGVKLYKSGSYEEAQKIFLQIERMKPGYKGAASYLKKANAKIEKGLQKRNANAVARSRELKTRNDVVGEALDLLEQRL
jgi:TolA-binding protein